MQHSIINSTPTSFFFSLTFPARTCNPMTTTRRLGIASFPDFPDFTISCPIIPAASLVRSLLAVVVGLRRSPFHLEGPFSFNYFVFFFPRLFRRTEGSDSYRDRRRSRSPKRDRSRDRRLPSKEKCLGWEIQDHLSHEQSADLARSNWPGQKLKRQILKEICCCGP